MVPLTVVGICSYAPAVHRWLTTLREHFDGPCLLYLTNPEPHLSGQLAERYGAAVIPVQVEADFWAKKQTGMFCEQWRYVLDACTSRVKDGFVLRTDVWDVVFQDDPRRYIDPRSSKIVVCREGPSIAEQPTNRAWVQDWLRLFRDAPVVNSGTICGPRQAVAVLAALLSKSPLGTRIDQSELELIVAAFPDSFEYRSLFLECLEPAFDQRGTVEQGRICDRETRKPWCVVHASGSKHKQLFNGLFSTSRYAPN